MFMGVTSHHSARRVDSYAGAQAVLAKSSKTPTGKQRIAKPAGFPLGGHSKSVTWVRECPSGAIAFQLYSTDVVVWYPDNSVEIDNFGSVTTSGFASRFLPSGISLHFPKTIQGTDCGHKGISYRAAPAAPGNWWASRRICRGDSPVRFRQHGEEVWLPDEADLAPMVFVDLDRKRAREVSREHHLKDFENWLSMAPRHIDIEHHRWDIDTCSDALKARDFRKAAEHLPLIEEPSGFGLAGRIRDAALPIATSYYDRHVTMGSLAKLRLALYDEHDLFRRVAFTTMPLAEFERRMTRLRQLESAGGNTRGLGPGT